MKNIFTSILLLISCGLLISCNQNNRAEAAESMAEIKKPDYGGYASQEKYGEHLVTICGCNDCHTPKKMGAHGPELDSALLLSGHPSHMPCPDVNRKVAEGKGVISTNDLTAWVGPWGVSYTANLTPDATGLGNWDEENFIIAIKLGKYKGMESSRDLLPPMPWQMYRNMTNDELKAVFAYLKSIKPVRNEVPAPQPPVLLSAR
jgi:hypothetical protein